MRVFFNIRFTFPRELRRGSLLLNLKAVTDEEFYSSIHYVTVARHKFEMSILKVFLQALSPITHVLLRWANYLSKSVTDHTPPQRRDKTSL